MKNNKEDYRKAYLASLHGHTYNSELDRTFPILKQPQKYSNWNDTYVNAVERNISEFKTAWICSDHHFSHKNIIKYGNRPFSNVDEMNTVMLKNHNDAVGVDDLVFMLGDINMGDAEAANKFLKQMNGYKILIIGNHDWNRKPSDQIKKYDVDEMYVSYFVEQGNTPLLLTHAPFNSHVPYTDGFINVHGHIHDQSMSDPSLFVNACVEQTEYTPILLNDLLE